MLSSLFIWCGHCLLGISSLKILEWVDFAERKSPTDISSTIRPTEKKQTSSSNIQRTVCHFQMTLNFCHDTVTNLGSWTLGEEWTKRQKSKREPQEWPEVETMSWQKRPMHIRMLVQRGQELWEPLNIKEAVGKKTGISHFPHLARIGESIWS